MIKLTNNLKRIYKNKRMFCKKTEKWFDRHLDPKVNKIHELCFKNIDLEIEVMSLKIKIKESNDEIIKILSEHNISKKFIRT
jgi:hypothetical protein